MALAVVIFLLVIGSFIFHFASPWWFTESAAAWDSIDNTITITFWVTGFVFLVCNLFLAWCVYKFRQKDGHKAVYEPENHKLEVGLSVFTTIGVIAMLAPGLFTWAEFVNVPEDAAQIEVLGQQWQWQYRYPGDDGILGVADTELVSLSNPFGVNPEDPNGQDDIIVNDPVMHLPVGQPIQALLRSHDVLHNYTVAQFRVKMDLVPGLTSSLWFETTREGTFDILCEELCGIGHFIMRGAVVVEPQEEFDAWLASQPTFAETQSQPAPNVAAGQAAYAACASCHGQNLEGGIGPNLKDAEWIHGGDEASVVKTISEGVAAKGMPAWGPILGPDKVAKVAAFILHSSDGGADAAPLAPASGHEGGLNDTEGAL